MYSSIPIANLDVPQIDIEIARCKIELAEASTHADEERKQRASARMTELQTAKKDHEHYQFVTMPKTIMERCRAGVAARDVFNEEKMSPVNASDTATSAAQPAPRTTSEISKRKIQKLKSKVKRRAGQPYSGLRATMQTKLKEYKVTKSTASKTVVGTGPNKFFITGGPL